MDSRQFTSRECSRLKVELEIVPCPKPRMTQSDRWNRRPTVIKYQQFADRLRVLWGDRQVPERIDIVFVLPMSRSWSNSKKLAMDGKPHQQKPDIDNLQKAFFDALLVDDSAIWEVRAQKLWGHQGKIIIRSID